MKVTTLILFCLIPGAASAHAGHLGELAGHDHVIAGIAIGAAIGAAVWGWLKGDEEPQDACPDAEEAEA